MKAQKKAGLKLLPGGKELFVPIWAAAVYSEIW